MPLVTYSIIVLYNIIFQLCNEEFKVFQDKFDTLWKGRSAAGRQGLIVLLE